MATDGYVDRWDDIDYNAADERRLSSVLLTPGATAFSSRSGRRPGGGGLVTTVVGSSSAAKPVLRTSAGAGVVFDPNNAGAGAYRFATPSAVDLTLGDRPGTGASRIDLIVARIRDVGVGVGAESTLKIELVQGNPGSSPSAPALPPLSMLVSAVNVPASGAITITPSTDVAVAAGGILPVASTAERDKLKTDGIAYEGMYVDVAATDSLDRFDGTNWVSGRMVRSYMQAQFNASYGGDTGMASLEIPAFPLASRVKVDIVGLIGYSQSANQVYGITVASSAGTLTDPQGNLGVGCPAALTFYPYSRSFWVDLPANTGTTISLKFLIQSASPAVGAWRGTMEVRRFLPGEYT